MSFFPQNTSSSTGSAGSQQSGFLGLGGTCPFQIIHAQTQLFRVQQNQQLKVAYLAILVRSQQEAGFSAAQRRLTRQACLAARIRPPVAIPLAARRLVARQQVAQPLEARLSISQNPQNKVLKNLPGRPFLVNQVQLRVSKLYTPLNQLLTFPKESSSTPSTTGLFGAQKPIAGHATPTSSSTAAGGGLFGGGLFGRPSNTVSAAAAQSTTSPSLSSTTASTAPAKDASTAPASGGLFGSLGATSKPTEVKSTAPGTTGAFSLFGAAKADDKKDESKGPQLFALPQTATKEGERASEITGKCALFVRSRKDANRHLAAPKAGAPSSIAVAPPSMLRGKTLEEIVNKWTSELETHVKEFNRFAGEVSVWDRALIENSKDIAALHSHVSAAEREQNDINQSLDHIEQQQKDLASALDAYEKIAQEILGGQGAGLRALDTGPADTERDKNYMLATDLHTQLDDLSSSLSQMIDSVNTLSLPGDATSADDPMSQISQILSNHLESLQWIDGAVREVENKVGEVEKRVKDSGISMTSNLTSKSRGFGVNR
ncbi:hypothetical protein AX15_006377 [Amanita polypyramis BW_CC]|nr:hypothetical protein AX15_006377 [Amanita polypyramis BW_CC]